MVDRNRATTIRMSDEEVTMLQELAEEAGLSVSDFLRQYVRRTWNEKNAGRQKKAKR